MKQLTDLKSEFNQEELLSNITLEKIKGGLCRDDKRRQRPGGGSSNTSLFRERTLIDIKMTKTTAISNYYGDSDGFF